MTLVMTFAGLEFLAMDGSSMSDGAQLTTTVALRTRMQNSGLDASPAYSLVSTNEPNVQAVRNFQLSLTLDVTIDGEDNMQVSLANQIGSFAAYKHDVHVRDWCRGLCR